MKVAFILFNFINPLLDSPQASEMARWLTRPWTYADDEPFVTSECREVSRLCVNIIFTTTESH